MTREDPIVIVSAVRTPMGGFLGDFRTSTPLLSAPRRARRGGAARLQADEVDEAVLGCVLAAGQGQAPARQAVRCRAGARHAVLDAEQDVRLGHEGADARPRHVARRQRRGRAGRGMESMSNAPYLLERARSGYRMGHGKVLDHMFLDGLEDAYDKGRLMGTFAEDCAEAYGFTREAQDEFAVASLTRAQQAMRDGRFQAEIVPLTVTAGKTERLVDSDEQPPKAGWTRSRP